MMHQLIMIGKTEGLVGYLKKNNVSVPTCQCTIHQQALASKSINIKDTKATVTSIVNKIRGGHNSLTHRKFAGLLDEMGYGGLLA